MSRVGRIVYAGVAGVVATVAVTFMALTVNEPRPVDVRRVDLSPAQPGVLSATFTTTVRVLPSQTPVLVAPPPQQPAPAPLTTTTEPPAAPPHATSTPKTGPTPTPTRGRPGFERCDFDDIVAGRCVPWRLPESAREMCAWLRAHGLPHVKVRDPRGREIDFDSGICDD